MGNTPPITRASVRNGHKRVRDRKKVKHNEIHRDAEGSERWRSTHSGGVEGRGDTVLYQVKQDLHQKRVKVDVSLKRWAMDGSVRPGDQVAGEKWACQPFEGGGLALASTA